MFLPYVLRRYCYEVSLNKPTTTTTAGFWKILRDMLSNCNTSY